MSLSSLMHESSDDPPFHFEIYRGPGKSFGAEPKAIYYVENHNAPCSYGELATDFSMAAQTLIQTYRETELGNWMAPVAHMVRQTLELRLKACLTSIIERDREANAKLLGRHDVLALWQQVLRWLTENGFRINEDTRLTRTAHLIEAFHAIDPSGDLFRFGISYRTAFDMRKSYDRVGINLPVLDKDFEAADGLLSHWDAAVFRIAISEEMGWAEDPFFDADSFPRE